MPCEQDLQHCSSPQIPGAPRSLSSLAFGTTCATVHPSAISLELHTRVSSDCRPLQEWRVSLLLATTTFLRNHFPCYTGSLDSVALCWRTQWARGPGMVGALPHCVPSQSGRPGRLRGHLPGCPSSRCTMQNAVDAISLISALARGRQHCWLLWREDRIRRSSKSMRQIAGKCS